MKKILFLPAFTLMISCSDSTQVDYRIPQKVIIACKIENINPKNLDVKLYVNRLGLGQTEIYTKADSLGNFQASFETYTPTDVWLDYKMNVLVLVHPGDSIYVEFNGKHRRRPAILKTIKFSGTTAKTNQDAAVFQRMYFSDPLYTDWDAKQKAKKNYGVEEYMNFLDTLKQKSKELYEKFVSDVSPNKETKLWALTYIEQDYYDALVFYPIEHHLCRQMANQLKSSEWKVPLSYYDPLLNPLPITEDMFVSGYALSSFINRFHFGYVMEHFLDDKSILKYKTKTGRINTPEELIDSLNVYSILKYTPDDLLKQMVLTELFVQNLESYRIDFFEKYSHVINQFIREPFLKEPLLKHYNQVKDWTANPQIVSDAMLKNVANSSAKQIMDSIMVSNQGKVIYLDCWATWCGSCRAELPNSKNLMEQMKREDVVFVFMCIDSEEKGWKATLSEFQLGGQHYFLTQEQSTDVRKAFKIEGIPHYFLIDKKGTIVEKGSHLRPNSVKEKIEGLLKE